MKKISILMALLAAFALTFVTIGCKNGEDGDDGTSAEALILRETANKWYKYGDTSTGTAPKNENITLATVYLKYDTSSSKLIWVAANDTLDSYAKTEKGLSSGKWAASIVGLRLAGKISSYSGNPTSGTELASGTDWGDFALEKLIDTLFGEL